MHIAMFYSVLAGIATIANLSSQMLVLRVVPTALVTSVLVGTAVGLIVKYVLDKRYIFCFRAESLAHDSQLFLLYTAFGLLTTIVFWAVEGSFYWLFGTDLMRYAGAVVGLSIGYFAKYRLDKKYVFAGSLPAGRGAV